MSERATTTLFAGVLVLAALTLPMLAALALDERTLNGVSVWDKPLKFELSLIVHLATLGLLVRLVDPATRASLFTRALAVLTVFAALFEELYIALQAARGRASHFNFETPIENIMYSLMGLGAVMLVVCAFAYGVMIARTPREGLGAGLKLGAVLGLTLGSALTLAIAGLMSTGMVDGPGHWVGGTRSDAQSLPLFGWSTTGGDLRVPHFFATHLMQAIPVAGLLADNVAPRVARLVVWAAAVVGVAIVGATFGQALGGNPLLAL